MGALLVQIETGPYQKKVAFFAQRQGLENGLMGKNKSPSKFPTKNQGYPKKEDQKPIWGIFKTSPTHMEIFQSLENSIMRL